jgi:hypothetical protein
MAAYDILEQIDRLATDDPGEHSKLIQLLEWRSGRERQEELDVLEAIGTASDARGIIDGERRAHDFVRIAEAFRESVRSIDLTDEDTAIVLIAEEARSTLFTIAHAADRLAKELARVEFDCGGYDD